ncbi:NTP transferase domain-containing protein [Paenalcaligenes niemegkensis]|uniref:NTP transferase domain-containing protein n=1 Tax=Paenalcaligenes niemegkensis TaxID=2895469 RepID=UPI0035681BAF
MAAIVGILLAAGVGKRFDSSGRCFKLVQAVDCENTVIERSACNLRQHCDQMIIVHGPRSAESWQATQHLDALQLSCTQAHLGMGASLKCAIAAMPPFCGLDPCLGRHALYKASKLSTTG